MLRHASLVMVFSDLLADPEPVLQALYRLRHGGHDVILFHVLDEAEVRLPLRRHGRTGGPGDRATAGARRRRLPPRLPGRGRGLPRTYRRECFQAGIDYVPLDTSMQFDKALTEYLVSRTARG